MLAALAAEEPSEVIASRTINDETGIADNGDSLGDDIPSSLQELSIEVLQSACLAVGLPTHGDQQTLAWRLASDGACTVASESLEAQPLPDAVRLAAATTAAAAAMEPLTAPASQGTHAILTSFSPSDDFPAAQPDSERVG